LVFHCKNGYTNAPQRYVMYTLAVMLRFWNEQPLSFNSMLIYWLL